MQLTADVITFVEVQIKFFNLTTRFFLDITTRETTYIFIRGIFEK